MTEFQVAKVPEDIARLVADRTTLDMVSVNLFCSSNYAKYISCFVETGHNIAPFLAKALDGDVLDNVDISGKATVSFMLPVRPDYCCGQRDGNLIVNMGQCRCRSNYSKVNPKFLR